MIIAATTLVCLLLLAASCNQTGSQTEETTQMADLPAEIDMENLSDEMRQLMSEVLDEANYKVDFQFTHVKNPSKAGEPAELHFKLTSLDGVKRVKFIDFEQAETAEFSVDNIQVKAEPAYCRAETLGKHTISVTGGYKFSFHDAEGRYLGNYSTCERGLLTKKEGAGDGLEVKRFFAGRTVNGNKTLYFVYNRNISDDPLFGFEYVSILEPTLHELDTADGDVYHCYFYDGTLTIYPEDKCIPLMEYVSADESPYIHGGVIMTGGGCAVG
jgi:hypothetical protein